MAGLENKLVTQGTELRNLKFGQDRRGQGSSREPFVNRDTLPPVTEEAPDLGLLGGNSDFLLRAGTLKRQVDDVSRITQLFTTGRGLAFVAKQNLLSRTNVKTQAKSIGLNQGPYLPTSTIAQVGVTGLGFHLNKQGVNPFAKTGADTGDDGTGGGFLQNIISAGSLPTYLSANVKGGDTGETNRLVQLKNFKLSTPGEVLGPPVLSKGSRLLSNIAGGVDNLIGSNLKSKVLDLIPNVSPALAANNISNAKNEILAYGGGPGSEIGVGRTRIRRYSFSDSYDTQAFRKNNYLLDNGQLEVLSTITQENPGMIIDFRRALDSAGQIRTNLVDAQKKGDKKNILTNSPDYSGPNAKNIESRVNLGNPGRRDKNLESYTRGASDANGNSFGPLDKVNALPLYQSTGVTANKIKNDLVKFRFAVYNPHEDFKKTYIHFRALLDSFKDGYTSDWQEFKYMGRSEKFYKYQGFARDISFSWKLAAQSRQELIPMYKKLNYLQSIMAGDYSPSGYMEGNIVDLTVGGYLWEQPGFLTSLNVNFPESSPYEIGIPDNVIDAERNENQNIDTSKEVKELPMYLEVSANFIPIHNFVPRKQQNKFDSKGGLQDKGYGRERFISLASEGQESSYTNTSRDYFNPLSNDSTIKGTQPSKNKVGTIEVGQGDFGVSPDTGTDFGQGNYVDFANGVING